MRPIPKKMRDEMAADPYYRMCARWKDGGCSGRITWEHVFIYAGRQINEKWAIIPICEYHHLGPGLDKNLNKIIAVERASAEDLRKYPRLNWKRYVKSNTNFQRKNS